MTSVQDLQTAVESLDKGKVLLGKAYELTFNESLGLPDHPFVVGAPYNPWPVPPQAPPKTFESSVGIAFKKVLAAGIPTTAADGDKVFIDIAHLWGTWIEFFNRRGDSDDGGPTNLAHAIGEQIDRVPPNATPVVRILIGGSEAQNADVSMGVLKGDVEKIFWPGGKCVFKNKKTEIHLGCYSPTFQLGGQTLDEETQKKLGSLLEIVKTMVNNIVDEIPTIAFGSAQREQLKTELKKLSAPEAIKLMAKTTIPSISWNHAKILAVDGKTMMTGGVNYWHDYGDNQNHINDVSAVLRGDAAISAHKYCNYFWKYLNRDNLTDSQSFSRTARLGDDGKAKWSPKFEVAPLFNRQPTATSGKPIFTVNKLGDWTGKMDSIEYPIQLIDAIRDLILNILFRKVYRSGTWLSTIALNKYWNSMLPAVSDVKLLPKFVEAGVTPAAWASRITRCKAIASATKTVFIDAATIACALHLDDPFPNDPKKQNKFIHQVLPQVNKSGQMAGKDGWDGVLWPYDLIKAVATFLDNVKNPNVKAKGGNGLCILLTSSKYTEKRDANGNITWSDKGWADLIAIEEFKQRVKTVAAGPGFFSFTSFDSWWDQRCAVRRITDDASMMNHCKVLCTDKKLMYVGSDNYYPSYNEEHGIWVDDSEAVTKWWESYWVPRWLGAKDASTDVETADFKATMT